MLNGNIFRKAQQLRRDKPALEMTKEELGLVDLATYPLLLLPRFNDILIDDGLEFLASVYDEANGSGDYRKYQEARRPLTGRR